MTAKQRETAMTKWKRRMAQESRRKREAYELTWDGRMAKIGKMLLALKHEFAACLEAVKQEKSSRGKDKRSSGVLG